MALPSPSKTLPRRSKTFLRCSKTIPRRSKTLHNVFETLQKAILVDLGSILVTPGRLWGYFFYAFPLEQADSREDASIIEKPRKTL